MKTLHFTLLLALLSLLGISACGKKSAANSGEYKTVQQGTDARSLVGQKVMFEGTETMLVEQHMMSSSGGLDAKVHFYIQPNTNTGLGQMVVYYTPEMIPGGQSLVNKKMMVYGTLGEVSGPGKGGGEHRELKLDLDKLEFLN